MRSIQTLFAVLLVSAAASAELPQITENDLDSFRQFADTNISANLADELRRWDKALQQALKTATPR